MKIGGQLMKALQHSGDKKLVGLWREQMEEQKQRQQQRQLAMQQEAFADLKASK
jgi:hypothetical protein